MTPRVGWTQGETSEHGDQMTLVLDLHDIDNSGGDIDRALRAIIGEAVAKKAPLVEIIPARDLVR